MAPKQRLTRAFFLLLSIVSLSSIVLMAALWIRSELDRSARESRRISEDYFNSVENSISLETDRIVDYLEAQTSASRVKFYIGIKNRVNWIHGMLSGIMEESGPDQHSAETRQTLLAMLRHLSSPDGREAYFCASLDGTVLLGGPEPGASMAAGLDPEALAQALESVQALGEGYYRLPAAGSGGEGEPPVTFLKLFGELDWVIGASERHSDFERTLGAELVAWLDSAPIPPGGSLLLLDYDGRVLSFRDPALVGVNVFEDDLGTGLANVAARAIRAVKSRTRGFMRLTLEPAGGEGAGEGAEHQGYFRTVPSWRWVLVNFVNTAQLAEALKIQEQNLQDNFRQGIAKVLGVTLGMLAMVFVISMLVSRKAGGSLAAFFHFFDKAATASVEIDPGAQPFLEFARLAEAANSMIRERREADRRLSDSELKFRTFFNLSPEIIAILDDSGRIAECNREFESFCATTALDAQGRVLGTLLGVDPAEWERILAELSERGHVDGQELVVRRGGAASHLLVFSKPMPFLDQRLYLFVCVDITARRQAEMERAVLKERLSRSQTMESMGRMASSVAHELNNILSAQIGYPELLLKDGGLTEAQRAQIGEIMDAGHRASEVVGDLLTLSRGVAKAKVAVDLASTVQEVASGQALARALRSAAKSVEVKVLAAPGAVIMASPSHMRKVVSNLVLNAVEILSGRGGRVEVSTGERRLDAAPDGWPDFVPGPYVVLKVSDDGPGIPEADLGRIFEPFYTKKSGSGRGLGLALVDLAVREHGGRVAVETSPRGTSFIVHLPRAPETEAARAPVRRQAAKGSGQTILVVDDVDIQRKLAQKMLRALGYAPLAVSSGEEAVDFLKTHDVDLIILDMIMDPGINGRQTYEAILAFKPLQKAIIASGLAENDEVARAKALGASHFVSKPYTLDDIASAVDKALHPEGAAAPPAGA